MGPQIQKSALSDAQGHEKHRKMRSESDEIVVTIVGADGDNFSSQRRPKEATDSMQKEDPRTLRGGTICCFLALEFYRIHKSQT